MNGTNLSLWDRFKIAITPKSHAEELVDQIYGPEGRGLIPVPETYDPVSAAQPAAYVELKQDVAGIVDKATLAVKNVAAGAQSSLIKLAIIAFVAIAALIAINAFMRR